MKKLILTALILLAGCAWAGQQKAYIEACLNDPVCYDEAMRKSKDVKQKASDMAALSPVPASGPIVGSVAGYLALVVFMNLGGKKLKKDDPIK